MYCITVATRDLITKFEENASFLENEPPLESASEFTLTYLRKIHALNVFIVLIYRCRLFNVSFDFFNQIASDKTNFFVAIKTLQAISIFIEYGHIPNCGKCTDGSYCWHFGWSNNAKLKTTVTPFMKTFCIDLSVRCKNISY